MSQNALENEIRPDPLGELERSPDPIAAIGGAYF